MNAIPERDPVPVPPDREMPSTTPAASRVYGETVAADDATPMTAAEREVLQPIMEANNRALDAWLGSNP